MEDMDVKELIVDEESSMSSNTSVSVFGSLCVDQSSSMPYADATKCKKIAKHVKRQKCQKSHKASKPDTLKTRKKPKVGPKKILDYNDLITSGRICSAAASSKNPLKTYDILTKSLLKRAEAMNLSEAVFELSREYCRLAYADKETDVPSFDFPDMSELLGKHWMLPNFGFEHLP